VAAAGNDSTEAKVMPCAYEGVICVGAHGPDGAFSHFSNYGPLVDLSAPGTKILSTWPINKRAEYFTQLDGFEYKNGTSMASPFVAGAVARLLGAGMSPREAYARLVLGARAPLPSKLRGPELAEKYTRSGNLDLAASLSLKEQPLILAASKSIPRLKWDRSARELPLKLRFANFWADAGAVKITARVLDTAPGASAAHLATGELALEKLAAGETIELATALVLDRADVESRLTIEAVVETAGAARTVRFPVEISAPITPASSGVETLAIRSGTVNPEAEIRTVKARDASPAQQDYIAVAARGAETSLQLLQQTDHDAYRVGGSRTLPLGPRAEMLETHRVDVNQDGKADYVALFKKPGKPGQEGSQKGLFVFQFLNADLSALSLPSPTGPRDAIEYDNQWSTVSERFQWMKLRETAGARLVPAWVGYGLTPELEKPAYDPWEPDWQDTPRNRLYYFALDGVRTVSEPKGFLFVQALAPTPAQRMAGIMPVLAVSENDGYRKDFVIARVSDGRVTGTSPLEMPGYRMFLGLNNLLDVTSLDPGAGASLGTMFAGASSEGALRATLVENLMSGSPVAHETVAPAVITDSIMRIQGMFDGAGQRAAFAETHYELQFHDFVTGERAVTSLNRFIYIPQLIFAKSFFPAVADAGARRLPALLVSSDLGEPDGFEVVAPVYAGAKLRGLTRPAALRLEAGDGCSLVGNVTDPTADAPSAAMFLCGDHFARVPLRIP
jgi:hypothetical protein